MGSGCVAPITRWANGNDTLWSGLEHGQWLPRALIWHNEGCVRCVGVPSQLPPRAIQRYSFRKPGIILIRATFHMSRKGMTDWWQCFRIFSFSWFGISFISWQGVRDCQPTVNNAMTKITDKKEAHVCYVGWSLLFVTRLYKCWSWSNLGITRKSILGQE